MDDGISVFNARNVVIDHVSVSGFGDGGIDITGDDNGGGSHDITVQWTIFGTGRSIEKMPNLIGGNTVRNPKIAPISTTRVSVHHNLYYNGHYRNPYCPRDDDKAWLDWPPAVVCDVRNNLIWQYHNHGTEVANRGMANVVKNYYSTTQPEATQGKTIRVIPFDTTAEPHRKGLAHVSGNYSTNWGDAINDSGNAAEFSAVVPATTDPRTAANAVRGTAFTGPDGAGARGPNFGLDPEDQAIIKGITIP
jgi:hypothetical protein